MAIDITILETGSITPDHALASIIRKYYLIHGEDYLPIPKPDGWVGLEREFKRDTKWHGFNYEGSNSTTLIFHEEEGKEFIEDKYSLYGQDALILVREVVEYGAADVIQYDGRLDLNSFIYENNSIAVTVIRNDIESLLKQRWETKVNFNDTTSVSGVDIASSKPTIQDIALHSKSLTYLYECNKPDIQTIDWIPLENSGFHFYCYYDSKNPQKNEISNTYERDMALSILNPVEYGSHIITTTYNTNMSVDISLQIQLKAEVIKKFLILGNELEMCFIQSFIRYGQTTVQIGGDTYTTPELDAIMTHSYSGDIFVPANSSVYVYTRIALNPSNISNYKGVNMYFRAINTSVNISALTTGKESVGVAFDVKNGLDFIVKSISDNNCLVESDFYDSACGKKKLITSGILLRYIKSISDPSVLNDITLTTTLRDLLTSLFAVDGVGFGFELNDGQLFLRVEPFEYFYQDVEIMTLENELLLDTYKEEVAEDLIFSEINTGYTKYPKEDTYGLDEYNTEINYKTPIRYSDNIYDMRSPYISSGYIIERQRRNPLVNESKASNDYDDDNFFLCVSNVSGYALNDVSVEFRKPYQFETEIEDIGGGELISVQVPIDPGNVFLMDENLLYPNSTIVISGSTVNNGTFTIKQIEYISYLNKYLILVNESVVAEYPSTCDINITNVGYISEKNDSFNTTNIIDPTTSYNLRISPPLNIINHNILINSYLRYKQGNEKILSKKAVQNNKFTIQRKETETCVRYDQDRRIYGSGQNITLSEFNDRTKIYSPERITVQAYLQPEQVRYITNAYRGIGIKKYGYITIKNPKGEDVECWLEKLVELENEMETKVEFTFIKKKT